MQYYVQNNISDVGELQLCFVHAFIVHACLQIVWAHSKLPKKCKNYSPTSRPRVQQLPCAHVKRTK